MSNLIDREKTKPERKKIDWKTIAYLSDIRSNYDCFNPKENSYYRALSKAISVLRGEDEQ